VSRGTGISSEARLRARLASAGLRSSEWGNGPDDQYAPHRHDYDKVIVVARGSIAFELPEAGRRIELVAGDRLELPAGTLHGASVGSTGVTCLEAHLPASVLPHRDASVVAGWGRADVIAGLAAAPDETAPGSGT